MRGFFALARPRNPLRCLAGYGQGLWPAWLAWGPNAGIFRACQTPQSAALLGGLWGRFVARMAGLEGRMRGSFVLTKPRNPLSCLPSAAGRGSLLAH